MVSVILTVESALMTMRLLNSRMRSSEDAAAVPGTRKLARRIAERSAGSRITASSIKGHFGHRPVGGVLQLEELGLDEGE